MTAISFFLSYFLWFLWIRLGGAILPADSDISLLIDIVIRGLIWLGPATVLFCWRKGQWLVFPKLSFAAPFPWLPAVVGVCLTVAFLHTARILLVGLGTWGIFQFRHLIMAASAAVIEETAFRAIFFNRQAKAVGVKWAALLNGLLFALYHYPEFVAGENLYALLGFRFWMLLGIGCVLSLAFAKWRNLGLPMLIHFEWNILCYCFALA